jgi:hypothetical protein
MNPGGETSSQGEKPQIEGEKPQIEGEKPQTRGRNLKPGVETSNRGGETPITLKKNLMPIGF